MEERNLSGILESDVVIPEIQREYVWGKNEKVLSQFIEELKLKKQLNIGFIYSYKPYKELNEIFLIDGQQRITTLILIAFYAAITEENKLDEFKTLMRLNGTKPAFSYRVRSCTKEFMLELFRNINNLDDLREIEKQKWFLNRYQVDKSISSMIEAFKIIDKKLKECDNIYDYIIENVKFWYFNVGETSQGEELYITMNSRGEALSDAEQIKPILFEKVTRSDKNKYGKLWDEIEEYFYKLKPNDKGIEVVDTMMNRFIQLILQIENKTEKYIGGASNTKFSTNEIQNISLEKIECYFIALKIIDFNFKEKDITSLLTCFYEEHKIEIFLFPLAALIKSVYLIVKNAHNQPDFRLSGFELSKYYNFEKREPLRLYKIVRNAVRRGTIKYVPLLKLLSEYNGEPIYDFLIKYHYPESEVNHVLSSHEMQKILIISNSESIEKTEDAFWEAQDSLSYLLEGSLKPLIEPFKDEKWTNETLIKFDNRKQITSQIFSKENIEKLLSTTEHKDGEIDNRLISRALLTFGDFAKRIGGDNWCFGYNNYWKAIFKEEKGANCLSMLLTKLSHTNNCSLYDTLQSIIKEYINNYPLEEKNSRYYFIKYDKTLLAMNDGYNIVTFWGSWSDYRIEVLNKERLSSYHVNPFLSAVIYKLSFPERKKYLQCSIGDAFSLIDLKNGISITCNKTHDWYVMSDKKNLNLIIDNLLWDDSQKKYIYPVDIKDDLIEKGVELFYKLKDLK